ncbi:MAG: 4Fe-4S binding protein [Bacteroidota bacterium]|nr:4Fe-4S binding protein [Bacteroidota bacterium]
MKGYLLLKKIRVLIALIFFLTFLVIFLDYRNTMSPKWIEALASFQFIPALLKTISLGLTFSLGLTILLILALLTGRVYCSTICPLGIMQDLFARLSRLLKGKKSTIHFKYRKPLTWIRYGILVLSIVILLCGSSLALNLLDPYSNFGRITSYLFQPLVLFINNIAADVLNRMNNFSLYQVSVAAKPLQIITWTTMVFIAVFVFAFFRGRLYCNSICPVGTLLGLFSKISFFRITIDNQKCTKCAKCMKVCKSECINLKTQKVDLSRCVMCMNCVSVCPESAANVKTLISQKSESKKEREELSKREEMTDTSKRDFVTNSVLFTAGIVGLSQLAKAQGALTGHQSAPLKAKNAVSPPGSVSIERFKSICTACSLCIKECPNNVIQPSFLEYGFTGMMLPRLDFHSGLCEYGCTKCTTVCPTGALEKLNPQEKNRTQLGVAHFVHNRCVVVTDGTDCGACSEHCPTKAVNMVPWGDLLIPKVDESICIGCGGCEHACPVRPARAIFVEGNLTHKLANKPKEEKVTLKDTEEFPF